MDAQLRQQEILIWLIQGGYLDIRIRIAFPLWGMVFRSTQMRRSRLTRLRRTQWPENNWKETQTLK